MLHWCSQCLWPANALVLCRLNLLGTLQDDGAAVIIKPLVAGVSQNIGVTHDVNTISWIRDYVPCTALSEAFSVPVIFASRDCPLASSLSRRASDSDFRKLDSISQLY